MGEWIRAIFEELSPNSEAIFHRLIQITKISLPEASIKYFLLEKRNYFYEK